MIKEIILITVAPILVYLVWAYQDKKRKAQSLSDRVYNLENNVTRLKNESR